VTVGHIDLIERAAKLFPQVIVAVLNNPVKKASFTVSERIAMLEKVCKHLPTVRFDAFDGLLVDYLRQVQGGIVLRGLRAVTDFEKEFQMAQVNHQIAPEIETLFLMASPHYAYISSSVVREIAGFGGDVSTLVPDVILHEVMARLNQQQSN
jgi:pantetheine-phosphate adenylyltransferase